MTSGWQKLGTLRKVISGSVYDKILEEYEHQMKLLTLVPPLQVSQILAKIPELIGSCDAGLLPHNITMEQKPMWMERIDESNRRFLELYPAGVSGNVQVWEHRAKELISTLTWRCTNLEEGVRQHFYSKRAMTAQGEFELLWDALSWKEQKELVRWYLSKGDRVDKSLTQKDHAFTDDDNDGSEREEADKDSSM